MAVAKTTKVHLHDASYEVRGDLDFFRHEALAELGEAAICHHSERGMDFLRDKNQNI